MCLTAVNVMLCVYFELLDQNYIRNKNKLILDSPRMNVFPRRSQNIVKSILNETRENMLLVVTMKNTKHMWSETINPV